MSTFQIILVLLLKKDFLWKNKRDKLKRVGLYQNYDQGGVRKPDKERMIKSVKDGMDSNNSKERSQKLEDRI